MGRRKPGVDKKRLEERALGRTKTILKYKYEIDAKKLSKQELSEAQERVNILKAGNFPVSLQALRLPRYEFNKIYIQRKKPLP